MAVLREVWIAAGWRRSSKVVFYRELSRPSCFVRYGAFFAVKEARGQLVHGRDRGGGGSEPLDEEAPPTVPAEFHVHAYRQMVLSIAAGLPHFFRK